MAEKTDYKKLLKDPKALKSQKKTYEAITGFFDKVTFGLSTPKKNGYSKKRPQGGWKD